jgi:hypothetical protein
MPDEAKLERIMSILSWILIVILLCVIVALAVTL